MMRRRNVVVDTLEVHPNLPEILGVLSQLPQIADRDLPRLADAWDNNSLVADARARALSPGSPLVVEVLAAFDAAQALFADDVAGDVDYLEVPPEVASVALKAVRDAIAAAYARPVLSRAQHRALMKPWRSVYPTLGSDEPDLGPRGEEVKRLLTALPQLAARCHDPQAAALFEALTAIAWSLDADMRDTARAETWRAAIVTSRRRLWALVRRSAHHGLHRRCTTCRGDQRMDERDEQRVFELCVDAACALLVADAVDDNLTDVLTLPLTQLIPAPRRATETHDGSPA